MKNKVVFIEFVSNCENNIRVRMLLKKIAEPKMVDSKIAEFKIVAFQNFWNIILCYIMMANRAIDKANMKVIMSTCR